MAEGYEQKMPAKDLYSVVGMRNHCGYNVMPDQTERVMNWLEHEHHFDEGDVILVGFPLSGIFWVQEALWHMYNTQHLDVTSTEGIGVRVPFLEHLQYGREPADVIRGRPSPRVYKYHMSAKFLRRHLAEGKVKVIVWLMNPREVMARYHMLYTLKAMNYVNFPRVDWDTFFELLKRDEMWEGNWFENTLSYLEHKDNENMLFMRYEEAGKDVKATAQKLADFCGRKLTPDQLDKVTKVMPFDAPYDWRQKFTPEQEKWFNEMYVSKTKGTDLENMYKE